jgi:hypothetical protein
MAGEHLVRLLQITGAALGIPAAAAGTFAAYQSYFSTDVTCQKLRNDIIGIMERNVPPETKRSLLKKEVTEFDKLCGERDPEARVIFQAAMSDHPTEAHAPAAAGPAPVSASSQPGAARLTCSVWRARLEGALRLGRAQSPRVGRVGAALHRLRHLRYVAAASRDDFIRQDHAAGLVRAAGQRQRSDQAAKPAAVRRLRARAGNARRHRPLVGRGRPGLVLVRAFAARRVQPFECSCEMESAPRTRSAP